MYLFSLWSSSCRRRLLQSLPLKIILVLKDGVTFPRGLFSSKLPPLAWSWASGWCPSSPDSGLRCFQVVPPVPLLRLVAWMATPVGARVHSWDHRKVATSVLPAMRFALRFGKTHSDRRWDFDFSFKFCWYAYRSLSLGMFALFPQKPSRLFLWQCSTSLSVVLWS